MISALGRQSLTDLCEFKARLLYIKSSKPVSGTLGNPGVGWGWGGSRVSKMAQQVKVLGNLSSVFGCYMIEGKKQN